MRTVTGATLAAALLLVMSASPALAGGSDDPTPYDVLPGGLQLPEGDTFPDHGHVNVRYTVDAVEHGAGIHFESLNGRPSGRFIGESFLPWSALVPEGDYCITWVQVGHYNEHFGEGGQEPVCTDGSTPVTPPAPDVPAEPERPAQPEEPAGPGAPDEPAEAVPPTDPAGPTGPDVAPAPEGPGEVPAEGGGTPSRGGASGIAGPSGSEGAVEGVARTGSGAADQTAGATVASETAPRGLATTGASAAGLAAAGGALAAGVLLVLAARRWRRARGVSASSAW